MRKTISPWMKLLLTGCLAALFITTGCNPEELTTYFKYENGNSIVVNPDKEWTTSALSAYIGNISALPQDLQTVIRQRFPKQASMESANVIIVGADEVAANAELLKEAAAAGAFIIVPGNVDLTPLGADPLLAPEVGSAQTPLLKCYSGWGEGEFFFMADEPEVLDLEEGASSMTESEWKKLVAINKELGDDGGVSLTDYDNDAAHNENYFQTRMDPFVEWLDATYLERGNMQGFLSTDYDNLQATIEQAGQRLTYNYPFALNEYIDKATGSDPDYLQKSGSISVEFRVYPIYMLSSNGEKAGDYYGVVSTITPHNQSMWGPYAASHGWCRNRIYGYWFSEMDVATSLVKEDGTIISGLEYFERPIPENKNDSKTYSNGKTFSMNGSFSGGYSGGGPYAVGTFGLGGTWTSSTNYTLDTINYTLDSSSPTVKYHYWTENVKLTDDWDDWTLINQNFPAPVRTEFSAHTMWVWHVPGTVVKDRDAAKFKLKTNISLTYCSWYHWRGAVEYDSNRKNHGVKVPELAWTLERPDRTPWGFIRLRNATSNEMAHVSFYDATRPYTDPVAQITTSFGKGEEARIALVEGKYNVTWDIIDGDTNVKLGSYIYRDVEVHQGSDDSSATVRISTVDGKPVE